MPNHIWIGKIDDKKKEYLPDSIAATNRLVTSGADISGCKS